MDASPWASPSLEELDELRDVEIYKAVVSSIEDWKKQNGQRKFSNRFVKLCVKTAFKVFHAVSLTRSPLGSRIDRFWEIPLHNVVGRTRVF